MSKIEEVYFSEASADQADRLKDRLRPIVADLTLTKKERGEKLVPILKEISADLTFDEASELWNNAMADLVEELGLGRH